jgi:hypothetical protein
MMIITVLRQCARRRISGGVASALCADWFYNRPHPGLLPQEKVNRSPSRFQITVSSVRATSTQIVQKSFAAMSSPGGEETGEGGRRKHLSAGRRLREFCPVQRLGWYILDLTK